MKVFSWNFHNLRSSMGDGRCSEAIGCIIPEVLEKWVEVDFQEPVWFKAGAQIFL